MVAKFVLLSTKLTSRKVQYFGQFVIESLGMNYITVVKVLSVPDLY